MQPVGTVAAAVIVKGAQTRSCSSPVLVEETAEQVAAMHSAAVILAEDGHLGGRTWWLQPQRPVGPVEVVMLDVGRRR
jgi:hypothetical protein